jgi:predicted RNA-binding Zn-ribbon protein involved in translation (DUF1610 family)
MITPEKCPKCDAALEGEKLGDKQALVQGKPSWSRALLITQHNRAFNFKCPDCNHEWPVPWMSSPSKAVDLE